MEKVSVIIPIYNAEDTLTSCVNGILEQTYGNLELILVDDGSADGSGALCDVYAAKDPRVVVYHQENRGVSAARNLGLSSCTGDYITFIDADDVIPPDYLEILVDTCRGADIALCDVVIAQNEREVTRFTLQQCVLDQLQALNYLLRRTGINSGPCAKLFRREIVLGITFPPLKASEDILFVQQAFCQAQRFAVTNRTEYRYIQNPQGAMEKFSKAPSMDIVLATDVLLQFIDKRKDLDPQAFYITVSHLMQYLIDKVNEKESRQFVGCVRKVLRKYMIQILRCTAFSWKEKVVYIFAAWGWLYQKRTLLWIGG